MLSVDWRQRDQRRDRHRAAERLRARSPGAPLEVRGWRKDCSPHRGVLLHHAAGFLCRAHRAAGQRRARSAWRCSAKKAPGAGARSRAVASRQRRWRRQRRTQRSRALAALVRAAPAESQLGHRRTGRSERPRQPARWASSAPPANLPRRSSSTTTATSNLLARGIIPQVAPPRGRSPNHPFRASWPSPTRVKLGEAMGGRRRASSCSRTAKATPAPSTSSTAATRGGLFRFVLRSVRDRAVARRALPGDLDAGDRGARDAMNARRSSRPGCTPSPHNRLVDHWREEGLAAWFPWIAEDAVSAGAGIRTGRSAIARRRSRAWSASRGRWRRCRRRSARRFLLHHEAEMSVAEIARATGANEEGGQSRLRYAVVETERGVGRWLTSAIRKCRRPTASSGAEEPPRALDEAILAAAPPACAARGRSASRCRSSLAAVLVLSVTVTLRMQHEQPGIETLPVDGTAWRRRPRRNQRSDSEPEGAAQGGRGRRQAAAKKPKRRMRRKRRGSAARAHLPAARAPASAAPAPASVAAARRHVSGGQCRVHAPTGWTPRRSTESSVDRFERAPGRGTGRRAMPKPLRAPRRQVRPAAGASANTRRRRKRREAEELERIAQLRRDGQARRNGQGARGIPQALHRSTRMTGRDCASAWSARPAQPFGFSRRLQEHRARIEPAELRALGRLALAAHQRGDRRRAVELLREREEVAQVLVHQLQLELRREIALEDLRQLGLHQRASPPRPRPRIFHRRPRGRGWRPRRPCAASAIAAVKARPRACC